MNAVAEFKPPRLPYHPGVEERFGIDKGGWKALVEAIFPAAETADSIVMALAYCKARKLDPFKRPVHIVPVYDSKRRCMVETVWPGISELRTTAMRTGSYAGADRMEYGPDLTKKLDGVEITFPEWASLTVYKIVHGVRVPFVGPRVYWLETYATAKRDTVAPNSMWRKRPRGQIDKCAEAAALRMAFPEEIGGDYAAEEMEGRVIGLDGSPLPTSVVARTAASPQLHAEFDEPAPVMDAEFRDPAAEAEAQIEAAEIPHDPDTGEIAEESDFPGDWPSTFTAAADEFGAESWARETMNRMDDLFTASADVDAFFADKEANRRFIRLNKDSPTIAKQLEAALNGRRKALRAREAGR